MRKIIFEQWVALFGLGLSLLLGAVLYGYDGDQSAIKSSLSLESQQRRTADSLLNISIVDKIQAHKDVDAERNLRYDTDIKEIKEGNIRMEEKIDKIIFAIKD